MSDIVKIIDIKIKNYKNVESGYIEFDTERHIEEGKSSITGLYGQNGSGKTTVIDAIRLAKEMISGKPLTDDIINYININSNSAEIVITFYIKTKDKSYKVEYSFELKKKNDEIKEQKKIEQINIINKYFLEKEDPDIKKYYISKEKIRYWQKNLSENKWGRVKTLMSISEKNSKLYPKFRRDEILEHTDEKFFIKMHYSNCLKDNKSFIFSGEILDITRRIKESEEYEIINILKTYMKYNLVIIDNRSMGLSDANIILPINIRSVGDYNNNIRGVLPIHLEKSSVLPTDLVKQIDNTIQSSNLVLNQIIPGFKVELKELSNEINADGLQVTEFQLLSVRGEDRVGLKYESDGIKKIVAIISVLIAMYNYEYVTVLIDEFDSGIFEYLLGEIIYIIEEMAKGQLIFTSHNLRPLEVLSKENLIFTTSNSMNRYIELKGVKKNKNLRDKYYRDLRLDLQDEVIYEKTSEFKIKRAFRKAGIDE